MDPITSAVVGMLFVILEAGRNFIVEVLKVGDGDEGERFGPYPATDVLGDATCAALGQDSGYAQPELNVPFPAGTVYRKLVPLPPNQGGQYAQDPPAENGNGFFRTAESGREQGDFNADSGEFTPMAQ